MRKQLIIAASLLFFASGWMSVSGQFDDRIEKFQAQKVAFFTERMQLTSTEAEKFWPLYNDYTNKKNKLEEESRSQLRYIIRNSGNMTEKEAADSLEKHIMIQEKIHQLLLEYHKKYLEVLPPKKVASMYVTETHFRTALLNQIRDMQGNRNPRRP